MKVVCDKCGCETVVTKYRAIALSYEYVEDVLNKYFEINVFEYMTTRSSFRKTKRIRGICGYILYKFTKTTLVDIGKRYGIPDSSNYSRIVLSSVSEKDPDLVELNRILSNDLNIIK